MGGYLYMKFKIGDKVEANERHGVAVITQIRLSYWSGEHYAVCKFKNHITSNYWLRDLELVNKWEDITI